MVYCVSVAGGNDGYYSALFSRSRNVGREQVVSVSVSDVVEKGEGG